MSAAAAANLGDALERAAVRLQGAGVDSPRRDARILLAAAIGAGPQAVIGYPERALAPSQTARFEAMVARRAAREPVSRILGRREFWGMTFQVTPQTLDPRPESETLVEAVLARIGDRRAPLRILDLGTGTGCLLLALLSELPRASGLGVDLSGAALATARNNARSLGLAQRARFSQGNWADGLIGPWQVIVSNPPYIMEDVLADLAPEVACYDPRLALSGGVDGLAAYRSLIPQAARLLGPNGTLALEVGAGQAEDVERLLNAAGLTTRGRVTDLLSIERCLLATCSAGSGVNRKTVG